LRRRRSRLRRNRPDERWGSDAVRERRRLRRFRALALTWNRCASAWIRFGQRRQVRREVGRAQTEHRSTAEQLLPLDGEDECAADEPGDDLRQVVEEDERERRLLVDSDGS